MISQRARNIVPSATIELSARVEELQRAGRDVIKLNIGEPDFPPPDNVCAAAIAAVEAKFSKYTVVPGILELRRAIADKLKRDNGLDYTVGEICVSTGAKQALQNALLALCDPGDEVILPVPGWVSYSEMIKIAAATPVFVRCHGENGFDLPLDAVERTITQRTKAILICSPQNPTGAIYSESTLRGLAALAEKHNFYILSDEIYEKLIYGGEKHFSVAASSADALERTVTINGFSKTYAMPGWRLGYTACKGEIARAISALQGHMTSAPNSIAQKAGVAALTGPQDSVEIMRREYERRRDYAYAALTKMPGIEMALPRGAFYLFPNVEKLFGTSCGQYRIENAIDLANYLLDEADIAVVFGDAFFAPGYLRLSYTESFDRIKEALERMGCALAKLKR